MNLKNAISIFALYSLVLAGTANAQPADRGSPVAPTEDAATVLHDHHALASTYFNIELSTRVELGEAGPSHGSMRLQGTLRVTPWIDDVGRVVSSFAFDEAELTGDHADALNEDEEVAQARFQTVRELGQTHFAILSANGRIVETRFPARTSGLTQSLAKYLISAILGSLAIPDDGDWTGDVRDSVGVARISCKLVDDGRANCVKREYLTEDSDAATRKRATSFTVVPEIEFARWQIQRDEGGFPIELEAHERLRATIPDQLVSAARSETSLKITKLGHTQVVVADLARWQLALSRGESSPLDKPSAESRRREADAARSRVMSTELALSILDVVSPAAKPGSSHVDHERNLARTALAAAIRGDGRLVRDVASRIDSLVATSVEFIAVLADAGTPKAQDALLSSLNSGRLSAEVEFEIVRQLSHVSEPTDELVSTMLEYTRRDKFAKQAWLGLGTLARGTQPSSHFATRSENIVRILLRAFEDTEEREQGITLIHALGNAAHPLGLPLLRQMSSSDERLVRYAALSAIGRYPALNGQEMDSLLEHAESDRAPRCRLIAVRGLMRRQLDSQQIARVSAIGHGDPSGDVRKMARRVEAALSES